MGLPGSAGDHAQTLSWSELALCNPFISFLPGNYFVSLPIPYLKVLLLGDELLLKHLKADPKINCPLNQDWQTPP